MNRSDFLNIIEGTVPFNRQMMVEINELINIFPYFQSAHLLLLKGLYNNADVKFDTQLKKSAIHIPDREVLYWFLKSGSSGGDRHDDLKVVNKGKPEPFNKAVNKEELVHGDINISESVVKAGINNEKIPESVTVPELVPEKDRIVTDPSDNTGIPDNDLLRSPETKISESHVEADTKPAEVESDGVLFLHDKETVISEDEIFVQDDFIDSDSFDLLELDIYEDKKEKKDEQVQESDHVKTVDRKLQTELIDKFIITNPRIEPQREKSSAQIEDLAQNSVEEKGGLVTETLAKIYINQEYYSKAIDIYEKLSLKFPEKSSYFASQIEKVKEYLKK